MEYKDITGVPNFDCVELMEKKQDFCVCIPIINEGERIHQELLRGLKANISEYVDIIICDGGSTDGSINLERLKKVQVNTILTKKGNGKQGAQLRMGIWWALKRGYKGIITIDGNNKDSIEDISKFVEKLKDGYDFVQGSRFINGGKAVRTPVVRLIAVRLLHAPVISLTARHWFTDTTNAYRGYSRKYLEHPKVLPFRDIFSGYELLAYLSVRASQLKLKVCEIPVTRKYPKGGHVPTKISPFKGNFGLFQILIKNFFGAYNPKDYGKEER